MNAVALRAHVESVLAKRCPAPFAPLRPKLNEKIPTGMAELDRLTAGGVPQGELSEICGPASSGRTSLLLALMAEVTSRGELCALVDVNDSLAPDFAAQAGVQLESLLWVRCGGKKAGGGLRRVERGMILRRHPFARGFLCGGGSARQAGGQCFQCKFPACQQVGGLIMRIACVYVPDFPVAAVMRAAPEICSRAVAVLEGKPPLTKVIATNQSARQKGIAPGMTQLQAEACPAIQLRWRSAAQEAAAHAALLDCAHALSPTVEDAAADTVFIDLAGLEHPFGS